MTRRVALLAALGVAALVISPAQACSPVPMPPPLRDESPNAYKARVEALQRRQAAEWIRARQDRALKEADAIFIARDTVWTPPYRPAPVRRGRSGEPLPPPPVPLVEVEYPAPSYYKPVDWLTGARSTALVRIARSNTTCGPMSIGDTSLSQPGNLYVFFARKGPLSEKNLIDAIAIDRISDPTLMTFVARYRAKRS